MKYLNKLRNLSINRKDVLGDLLLRSDHLSVYSEQMQLFLFRVWVWYPFFKGSSISRGGVGRGPPSAQKRRGDMTRQGNAVKIGKERKFFHVMTGWMVFALMMPSNLTWPNYARTFSLSVIELLNVLTNLVQKYKSCFVSATSQSKGAEV